MICLGFSSHMAKNTPYLSMDYPLPPQNFERICPVFLAGGYGSRLAPLSSPERPKQFIPLNDDETLFEKTLKRFMKHPLHFTRGIVVANSQFENYLSGFKDQVLTFLQEPPGKNTAAACMLGALAVEELSGYDWVCFIPCDHMIENDTAFVEDFAILQQNLKDHELGLFGISPDRPSTHMGYMRSEHSIVTEFIEKPTKQKAKELILSQKMFWNSGIILARVHTFLEVSRKLSPEIFDAVHQIWIERHLIAPQYTGFDRDKYEIIPSQPIDKAILEKHDALRMQKASFDWSDLGSARSILPYLSEVDAVFLTQGTTAPDAIIGNTL